MRNSVRRLLVFAWLVSGLAVAGSAYAQQAPAGTPAAFHYAVIDVQKILRDANATRTIRPQIEKLKNDYQAQFKKEEDELRAADQDLQRQRAILSPEAFDERRKEFQRRAGELQRKVQEARRVLDDALSGAMAGVNKTLRDIVGEVAAERKLQLILLRSAVMLVETRLDITDEVLKRLNEKMPSVKVTLPARRPGENPN